MTLALSPNTQAILLLTAPLIAGRGSVSPDLLSPGEYKRLARHLREIQHQPADLVSPDATDVLRACQSVIDRNRLQKLLGRSFLLSQVVERWQARAIWVVSRADTEYPRRLKARFREDAPAILYGCGERSLLESGGLAVVGSRQADDDLINYTMSVGRLVARAGRTLVSGGAKGVDQAAMRGALEAGGNVCGVLADGLEKTTMNREHRNLLLDGQLVLISPYDPSASFNVGNAMQRNKLIYGLADTALVVSSDLNKGGTWAGAVEQLEKLRLATVFVRSTGEPSDGLDALRKKGARLWPNPRDVESLSEVFSVQSPPTPDSSHVAPPLFDEVPLVDGASTMLARPNSALPQKTGSESSTSISAASDVPPAAVGFDSEVPQATANDINQAQQLVSSPSELLFAAARAAIQQLLVVAMKDAEVAVALDVSNAQAKAWLQRLVDEGVIERQNKPVRYVVKQKHLFD